MSKWRTIETAPKDGTEVLVWWPFVMLDDEGNVTGEIATDTRRGCRMVISFRGNMWEEPPFMEAVGDWFGDDREYAEAPTHWMPLPEAPQ